MGTCSSVDRVTPGVHLSRERHADDSYGSERSLLRKRRLSAWLRAGGNRGVCFSRMRNLVSAISQGVPVRRADSPRARTGVLDCFKIHVDSFLNLFAAHRSESIGCNVGNQTRSVQAKQLDVGIGDTFVSVGATIRAEANGLHTHYQHIYVD
jgi:hypothetical protein